ncbi:MAG TPA: hypothetical protein DHV93_05035 [Holophagaceae bacterium]|nr:hypothetical protein [Holophagaceae bacterium]
MVVEAEPQEASMVVGIASPFQTMTELASTGRPHIESLNAAAPATTWFGETVGAGWPALKVAEVMAFSSDNSLAGAEFRTWQLPPEANSWALTKVDRRSGPRKVVGTSRPLTRITEVLLKFEPGTVRRKEGVSGGQAMVAVVILGAVGDAGGAVGVAPTPPPPPPQARAATRLRPVTRMEIHGRGAGRRESDGEMRCMCASD